MLQVAPICIPTQPNPDGGSMTGLSVYLSGWGQSFATQYGATSILKSAKLEIYSQL